jgi:hypothetical protein
MRPRLATARTAARAAACAAALALPLHADPATDYARLIAAFPDLVFGGAPGRILQAQTDRLPALEGTWILAAVRMGDGTAFPPADQIATACGRLTYRLAVTGPAALTLTRTSGSSTHRISLVYAGGSTHVAAFDQTGYLGLIFGATPPAEVAPDMPYGTLTQNPWLGFVSLMPVGPDLILVQPLGRPPDLLVRCP